MAGSSFQISAEGGLIEVHADGTTTRIQPLALPRREDPEAGTVSETAPAKQKPAPKKSEARRARDILLELRSRLRDVNAQIRARKSLEKERDQLVRLIAAARGKTIAPVRELKRSAG